MTTSVSLSLIVFLVSLVALLKKGGKHYTGVRITHLHIQTPLVVDRLVFVSCFFLPFFPYFSSRRVIKRANLLSAYFSLVELVIQ